MNIFTQYVSRVKKSIHIILCMSPLGEVFRTRLRMFPSLINCCTIDWFSEWYYAFYILFKKKEKF